ncbi:MAG: YihY/virulence factor BrkB family protein [Thermoanaerobaculia bacterium]
MAWRRIWNITRESVSEWLSDGSLRLAAAVAFFAMFSIVPLIVFLIWIIVQIVGPAAARGEVASTVQSLVGHSAAVRVQHFVLNVWNQNAQQLTTVLGLLILVIGASGVFYRLKEALAIVWNVPPKKGRGWKGMLWDQVVALVMVVGALLFLFISVLGAISVAMLRKLVRIPIPGGATLWQVADLGVFFLLLTTLFAMIFKYVPDVHVKWRNVWLGASITSILVLAAQFLLGLYFSTFNVASAYGAAGSLYVLLLWIYLVTAILLLGAEVTEVVSRGDRETEEDRRRRQQEGGDENPRSTRSKKGGS